MGYVDRGRLADDNASGQHISTCELTRWIDFSTILVMEIDSSCSATASLIPKVGHHVELKQVFTPARPELSVRQGSGRRRLYRQTSGKVIWYRGE